jgi:16S rRNA (guanine527-N7)-methyltransferase
MLDLPDVSHETKQKLEIYHALLVKWQKAINLVSPATLADAARRHFMDSTQLLPLIPDKNTTLADLGSGAGFPGMVLAILGVKDVHLVESDLRKSLFLREVARETDTTITVHNRRIEDCHIPQVGIITARALAPLTELLGHMSQLAASRNTIGLFLKGAQTSDEIEAARKKWDFAAELIPSITDNHGKVIKINNLIPIRCYN